MALDHVRDYVHISAQTADPLNLETTTPALFFTRWITHFCAPVFVFLSGTSAWLFSERKTKEATASYLLKRGIWLVVADIVLVNLVLTFNPLYNFVMLTVIWAIGWSMIFLSVMIRMAARLILPIGLLIFLGHDLITTLPFGDTAGDSVMRVLFQGLFIVPVGKAYMIGFLYAILPWTAIMFLGYAFGAMVRERGMVFKTGLALCLFFVLLRVINLYGDPSPWVHDGWNLKSLLSFINTSKYPPSLQFACMTLGPALLFLSALEPAGATSDRNLLTTYGRVPFFYYVLHLLLAHIILVVLFFATGRSAAEIIDPASPFLFRPKNFGFDLWGVYGVWLLVVVLLYQPCRWFYRYKRTHTAAWLKYV